MSKPKKLPAHIYNYVNRNTTFNMFGLINLTLVKASTNSKLSLDELQARITRQFSGEVVGGQIEFKR